MHVTLLVVSGSLGEMYSPGACLARTTSDRPDRLRLHDAASADYTYHPCILALCRVPLFPEICTEPMPNVSRGTSRRHWHSSEISYMETMDRNTVWLGLLPLDMVPIDFQTCGHLINAIGSKSSRYVCYILVIRVSKLATVP